jgi:hypothetical protein
MAREKILQRAGGEAGFASDCIGSPYPSIISDTTYAV